MKGMSMLSVSNVNVKRPKINIHQGVNVLLPLHRFYFSPATRQLYHHYYSCILPPLQHGHSSGHSKFESPRDDEDVLILQVDDLLGMQNANLLNLPENYTFKYCRSFYSRNAWCTSEQVRPVPRSHVARAILCCSRPARSHCRVHLGKDVSPTKLLLRLIVVGKRSLAKSLVDTSHLYLSSGHTVAWVWRIG